MPQKPFIMVILAISMKIMTLHISDWECDCDVGMVVKWDVADEKSEMVVESD